MGILAVILGILAVACAVVATFLFGTVGGVVAGALGVVAIVLSVLKRKKDKKGGIAGIIIGALAIILALALAGMWSNAFTELHKKALEVKPDFSLPGRLCVLLAAVLLVAAIPCVAFAEGDIHAIILATSDLHGSVWSYSHEDNAETGNNGMARLYTYIKQVREESPVVFLVDAGDDIQGTIMTDDIANKSPENEHPVVAAMNFMGYDAMTLGNHEFNWGIQTMKTILQQA